MRERPITIRVLVLNNPPALAGEAGFCDQALDHELSPRVCMSIHPEVMLESRVD